jgi:nucleoside phosphorylase
VLARRLQRFPTSLLLFTGTAGQLDPSCPMGTVVCPETWRDDDQNTLAGVSKVLQDPLRARGWEIAGCGLTVSLPVLRASSRRELFERTGAAICDMEAGAALQVAESLGIPALAVKVVSDSGDCTFIDFYRHLSRNLQALGTYLQRLVKDLDEIVNGQAPTDTDGCGSAIA